MADTIRDWLIARTPENKKSESPIERLFEAAYEFMKATQHFVLADEFKVEQQVEIGDYRADFVFSVKDPDGRMKRLVVEMDGHDFHERTKAQAARDKARDRYMLGLGIEVMRFTGSEVWGNPFACVDEVIGRCYVLRYGCSPAQARGRAALADLDAFFRAA